MQNQTEDEESGEENSARLNLRVKEERAKREAREEQSEDFRERCNKFSLLEDMKILAAAQWLLSHNYDPIKSLKTFEGLRLKFAKPGQILARDRCKLLSLVESDEDAQYLAPLPNFASVPNPEMATLDVRSKRPAKRPRLGLPSTWSRADAPNFLALLPEG
eukprot:TRINITY_DN9398_c0_g1_i1.p1 TRINITY_DN9398_c0_g1~~TRINITY_DN9398_c0_g1_i1.p1  ORF type:complete len:161 (-),score=31.92 TRINITY_DN9398_c0_g1_i1:223-705(-)